MGVAERKAREKVELRQEILEAARTLFIEEGYERVSMRRLAEKIEYSPTTIYHHFKDKADLMFCVCEQTFAKLIAAQEDIACRGIADPLERLRVILRTYIEFGVSHPDHYKISFLLPYDRHTDTDHARYLDPTSMGMRAYANLRQAVADCISASRFREVDVEAATQVIWTAVHGLTSALIVHFNFPWADREQLVTLLIEKLLAGFQTTG